MSLELRLRRWVEAGLVTGEQAQRITAFEREQRRPMFIYAVAGLASLAIAIGLVSIVAANWDAIPGRVKIGIALALVAGLGAAVARIDRTGPPWLREASIIALYGLVLASIALVGQVYQLGGEVHEALATWSVLTALLMTRARSGFAATVWLVGLQATWVTWAVWFAGHAVWLADRTDLEAAALSTIYWIPLLCLALGSWSFVARVRPALGSVLRTVGWVELVLAATVGTFVFYFDTVDEDWTWAYPGSLVSVAVTGWLATRLPASDGRRAARALLVACLLLSHVPLFVSPGELDLVAALTFIGLWLLVARAAHRGGDARTLNAATAIVGIRILIVYFEVFGSLLDTGVGLVLGGLLTLGLAWVWARKRKDFSRELSKEGGS